MSQTNLPALRYDWAALEHLRAELGEDYAERVVAAVESKDLEALAQAVAAGSDLGVTEVWAQSPAIFPTQVAVIAALSIAFHGIDGPQDDEGRDTAGKRKLSRLSAMWRALRYGAA